MSLPGVKGDTINPFLIATGSKGRFVSTEEFDIVMRLAKAMFWRK
jgi:hypothetical protein